MLLAFCLLLVAVFWMVLKGTSVNQNSDIAEESDSVEQDTGSSDTAIASAQEELAVPTIVSTSAKTPSSETILKFGKTGGFTGASYQYGLNPIGDLFNYSAIGKDPEQIGHIDPKVCEDLTKQFESLYADLGKFVEPGNISYHLTLNKEEKKQELIWGAFDKPVDERATILYNELMLITQEVLDQVK